MNEREAIEQLKLEIASVKGMTIDCDRYADFAEKTISSFNMAIAALEKQVANKLDYDDNVNYCPNCGQRLKWEE